MALLLKAKCESCEKELSIENQLIALRREPKITQTYKYTLYNLALFEFNDMYQTAEVFQDCDFFCSIECFAKWLEKVLPKR